MYRNRKPIIPDKFSTPGILISRGRVPLVNGVLNGLVWRGGGGENKKQHGHLHLYIIWKQLRLHRKIDFE